MRKDVIWKYQNDTVFHHLVSSLIELIQAGLLWRQDLRDAVELAIYIADSVQETSRGNNRP